MGRMLDLIIAGGRVLDGAGNPWLGADVGVKDGRIVKVGDCSGLEAESRLDARDMVVAPGFIDPHSHADLDLISSPQAETRLMQGITTEVVGQDGMSAAPIRDEHKKQWAQVLSSLDGVLPEPWPWNTMAEYLDALAAAQPAVNVAVLAGQGTIRQHRLGLANAAAGTDDIRAMADLTARAMAEGAFGLSTGLIYLPCVYSPTDELVELYRVVAQYGGSFVIHMRNEGHRLLEAVEETLDITRRSGVRLHISHLKAAGRANWDKTGALLERLERARDEGLEVTFDQYPYTAGSTMLMAVLPPWALEGGVDRVMARLEDPETRRQIHADWQRGPDASRGTEQWESQVHQAGWDNILITSVGSGAPGSEVAGDGSAGSQAGRDLEGLTVAEIARRRGVEPGDACLDLLLQARGRVSMAVFTMSEESVRAIMAHPLGTVCTDGLMGGGKPHPRLYGSFPRVLGRYVREEGLLSLPEAVRKMTSLPAQVLGLQDRGLVREGMAADLTVFDPATVADRGTYDEPRQFPVGIHHVVVNGRAAVTGGELTGQRAGRVLRRQG